MVSPLKHLKVRMAALPIAIGLLCSFSNLVASPLVGLTSGNRLVQFDSSSPGSILSNVAVSGLAAGHSLVGIDYRPLDQLLIGVARDPNGMAQIYSLNLTTGMATALSSLFSLPGTAFGVDFNPVPNALRLVSDAETNLRITMGGSGTVNTDGSLTRTAGSADPTLRVIAAAYGNNNPGGLAGNTTLYVVDAQTGNLYTQGTANFPGGGGSSPNTGILFLIGSLGLGTGLSDSIGFDIRNNGEAFLSLVNGGGNMLFSVNVANGQTVNLGAIGGSGTIIDITASPVPEPATFLLSGIALVGAAMLRRKKR